MPASSLPANPSPEHLRKQAKDLRKLVRSGHAKFVDMARRLHPRLLDPLQDASGSDSAARLAGFTLADAQLVVARRYGFASWRLLSEHLDVVARYGRSLHRQPVGGADDRVDDFLRLACLSSRASDIGADPHRHARARELLAAHAELASANIYTAATVGDVAAAGALLAADPSLSNEEGGPYGWPPLLYLAFSRVNSTRPGHSTLEVARLLLAHGADPDAGYLPDGEPPAATALSGAFRGRRDPVSQPAHQYSLPLARLLLDAGADPNDPQAVGNASGYPHEDTHLSLLLDHGLGRGSGGPWRSRLGDQQPTPARLVQAELRYAAEWNLLARVRLLLRHCAEIGIDLDATGEGSDRGRTAYDLAVLAGNTGIADLLAAAGALVRPLDPVDRLVAACLRADRPTVRRLLAADATVAERAVSTAWSNPLQQAVYFDRPDAVRLLVSLGFPVNDRRAPALHMAAAAGHLDVVKLLVELGADTTATTDNDAPGDFSPPDATALGWARHHSRHDVVAYLAGLPTVRPTPRQDAS